MKQPLLLIITLFLVSGCDIITSLEREEYKKQYVVDSYLVANETLPEVRLTTTSPIEKDFDSETIVRDADVQIRLLHADGTVAESYRYQHFNRGRYIPIDTAVVKPSHSYQLYITFSDGHTLESKTHVPGDFKVTNSLKSSYIYKMDNQIELVATPSSYPGRQSYYLFTVEALNPGEENLTPFYRDLIDEKGQWINSFHINASEITSESIYSKDSDGNIILDVPWSVIAFYGKNKISANVIDDNIYQTWPAISPGILTAGMTFSPGNSKNVPNHIKGGIGIFGSIARVTRTVDIERK